MDATLPTQAAVRSAIRVDGAVQGVGYRPFVFRQAVALGLSGWIANDAGGVGIEVEGPADRVGTFVDRLRSEAPPLARVHRIDVASIPARGEHGFEIRTSDGSGAKVAAVLPDVATCPDCLAEILDAGDRRHGYPFANCTCCGPRYTIVRALPYDRPNTSMAAFPLCEACRSEYDDPHDRRFHAQPVACPECGPRLTLVERSGREPLASSDPIAATAAALRSGRIVAAKGLGGFHLLVDARDEAAVAELRRRKRREEKPLAVMVADLAAARRIVETTPEAESALSSPEAPIVLLPRRADAGVASGVAPRNPDLGVMLAATPLHHLLCRAIDFPIVATSGNLTDEPICHENDDALERLGAIADLFLTHDRPIVRPMDDSVGRICEGGLDLIRRSRGFAPLPVRVPGSMPTILAVGAHQKNTVGLGRGGQVVLSQHLGDLETEPSVRAFERAIEDLLALWDARPEAIACDLHPDYFSTRWAEQAVSGTRSRFAGLPIVRVQHHHAHLAACLAENGHEGEALGIVWDGTGLGTDGTIWGGEFLRGSAGSFERIASLRPFRLPGGAAAVREPRRVAFSLLREVFGPSALSLDALSAVRALRADERRLFSTMLDGGAAAPLTTSIGRLFDGVASLAGIRQVCGFEGQAAMELEAVADPREAGAYPLPLREGVLDWRPLVGAILEDLRSGKEPGTISARFHAALVDGAVAVAAATGSTHVALAGGCFQNRRLTEALSRRLREAGHVVLRHRIVPPNDGSIALGQTMVAAAILAAGR